MVKFKKGFPAKGGKTTEALQKVIELCLNNQSVLYINNEQNYEGVWDRLKKLSNNTIPFEEFYFYGNICELTTEELEEVIFNIQDNVVPDGLKKASIVIDIGKDVSDLECEHDLYVYYQTPRR